MIIGLIAGSESFSAANAPLNSGTVKMQQWFMRDRASPMEPFPFAWKKPTNMVSEIGRSEQHPASQQNRNHGVWVTSRWNVPEGSFVVLQIMKRMGGEIVWTDGMFLLHMRESAALRRLRIPFTGADLATFPNGLIEGRFDLVPPTDFDKLGITFPEPYADKFWYDNEDGDWFEEIIVERETRPAQIATTEAITTETGKVVQVTRTPARRVINIRPKK
ncbi:MULTISPECIES: hypothetical protein [unclassified Bradyrhizobium]|uniref:hypothetical protein n=1 Tax=unclassified Bradyrhizobium TaxID=2631580 RepID=UPI003393E968